MYPLNFLVAVTMLGVTVFYLSINWMNATRGSERYQNYRNAFCLTVIFLSFIQIIRAFAPLEQQNRLLQIGVSSVMVLLFFLIKIFEILAGLNPGRFGTMVSWLVGIAAMGALLLPGGGYYGQVNFTKEQLFDHSIFIRPTYGDSPYRPFLILCGLLGLGYKFILANLAAKQKGRAIGQAMLLLTVSEITILTWNFLCGTKIINGTIAPGLFGVPGVLLFMWIDRTHQTALTQENTRLGAQSLAQTSLLEALVSHGAFACAQFDATGTLVSQNDKFRHSIAPLLPPTYTPEDSDIVPVGSTEKFRYGLARALKGSIQSKTITWTAKDGESVTYRTRFIPFKPTQGESNHVIVCFTDITEDLESRQQLMEAKHLQAIGLLASGVAHEYNNILTGVIAMGELALREAVTPSQRTHLEIVVEAAKRCTDLSGNLLALSRNSPRQNQHLDLREVINETIRLIRHSRGVTINLLESIESGPHITVEGNRNELATLLLNLLINACDAMQNMGTITLRIDYKEVPKNVISPNPALPPESSRHVILDISDTGPGIPEDIIPHIFEPFFTTKSLGKGSGLGLATAKAIVTSHHGHIEAKYTPGGGAHFEITLPLYAGLPTLSPSPFPILPPSVKKSGHAAVIDDDPIVLATTTNILHDLGYEVASYASAESFIETSTPETLTNLKLVVIDIRMPGMDGVQLCRRLLTHHAQFKIILVTGHTEKYDTQKLAQLQNVSILMKPFSLTALQNLIIEIETQSALMSEAPIV
ncbi:MAG: ATP-binding protein [Opitutaceae bacterium]